MQTIDIYTTGLRRSNVVIFLKHKTFNCRDFFKPKFPETKLKNKIEKKT